MSGFLRYKRYSPPDDLQNLLATMDEGTWAVAGTNTLSDVLPSPLPGPVGATGAEIMTSWSGGCLDTTRNRLILPACGGHGDYYGNEVYAFDLPTLTWSRLTEPTVGSDGNPTSGPRSRHTYGGVAYIASIDAVLLTDGSTAPTGGKDNTTWLFDCGDNTWSSFAGASYDDTETITAYDSVGDFVYTQKPLSGGKAWLDPSTQTWTSLGGTGQFHPGLYFTPTFDTSRRRMWALGGGTVNEFANSWLFYWSTNPKGSSHTALAMTNGTALENVDAPGFVYVPNRDELVAWKGGSTVYRIAPDTGAVTTVTASAGGDTPTSQQTHGTYGRFQYVADYDCFIAVNAYNGPVYVYKPGF